MQFYDEVVISLESGKGGDGCVSGRRETGIPHGGPSGGNGGKGGSVILKADKNINTLLDYKFCKHFKALNGESGKSKDQYGANAENLILKVPVGTLIRDYKTQKNIFYFSKDEDEYVVAEGGSGGLGNIEFKTPILQYPNFALIGEPGHKIEVSLELQLLGDVALIGTPSVGKSSIINSVSNTKAKVADYPFTTLVPHLGSVKDGDFSFNIVDIPGLIKGAAQGKGLGNSFLRHILKSKIFCVVSDISRYNQGIKEVLEILDELFEYMYEKFKNIIHFGKVDFKIRESNGAILLEVFSGKELLTNKHIVFVINKEDLLQDQEIIEEYKKELTDELKKYKSSFLKKNIFFKINKSNIEKNLFVVSAATHYGLNDFINKLSNILQDGECIEFKHSFNDHEEIIESKIQKEFIKDITDKEKKILIEKEYIDKKEAKFCRIWEVNDQEFSKLVFMLPRGNDEAELWFWKTLEEKGFMQLLSKAGMVKGDILKVVSYYEGQDSKYILY